MSSISVPANKRSALATTAGMNVRVLGAGLLTALAWGSAFAAIRAGLQAYTPTHLALLRYIVGSLVLVGYALITKMPLPRWQDVPRFAALGLIGITVYNLAWGYGQQNIPAATASFLIASAPVWMALLGRLILREKLRTWGWIGIIVSFGGVVVIALGKASGLQLEPSALIVLVAALAQSIFSLSQKPLLKRYSPLQCTAYAIWAGTFFLIPFGGGLITELQAAPFAPTAAIIYMGIVPGALGYVLWAYVLSNIPAARAGSFLYLVPPCAMLLAWLWLGEAPAPLSLVGGALVLTGVILVNTLGKRQLQKG